MCGMSKLTAGGSGKSFSVFFPFWVLVNVHIGCVGPISSHLIGRRNHLIGPAHIFGNTCARESPDYTKVKRNNHLNGPISLGVVTYI